MRTLSPRSMAWRCVGIVLSGWLLQLLFVVPLCILALLLSESGHEQFPHTPVQVVIALFLAYLTFLIPAFLVTLGGRILENRVSADFWWVKLLQPAFLLLVLSLFTGPSMLAIMLICLVFGCLNLGISWGLLKWLRVGEKTY